MKVKKDWWVVVNGPFKGFAIPLTAAQRAFSWRKTGGRVDLGAQRTGNGVAGMRWALVAWVVNGVSG